MRSFGVRAAVAGMLVLAGACTTERDEQLIDEIGVTRLLLIDTGLVRQSAANPNGTIQVAEWAVIAGSVDIQGTPINLVPGAACVFVDSALVAPGAQGSCSSGFVVQALQGPQSVTLTLQIGSMKVRRAKPPEGADDPLADSDGDSVSNEDDACPFLPFEADADDNGLVDCFRFDAFGQVVADSDGDGVADGTDNCLWVPNPAQLDTSGTTAAGIPDGIGDACIEQVADVVADSAATEFLLHFDGVLNQPLLSQSFLTVDFRTAISVPDCDWENGICPLDTSAVKFCVRETGQAALLGCF